MFEWQKRVESSSKPSCPVTAFFVSGDGFIFFGLPAPNNGLHNRRDRSINFQVWPNRFLFFPRFSRLTL